MGIKMRAVKALILTLFFVGAAFFCFAEEVVPFADKPATQMPAPAEQTGMPPVNEPEVNLPREEIKTLPVVNKITENPKLDIAVSAGEGNTGQKRISLDLKGIDIIEFLRILSLKMGITIVSSKSVAGRINIFLNNLTIEDALDVVLLSQDLACDRKDSIINVMTSAEYERLYGKKYYDKRKIKTVKLLYAKPATVFSALGQLKSDIGKVIVDEATGTMILIDIPEKIDFMMNTIKDLDKIPQTEIFDLKYAKAADIKTHLSSAITTGPGELFVDEKSAKIMVTDLPDKMEKIKKMMNAFDEPTPQVLIESEIVQITLNKEFQRNINWEKVLRESYLRGLDFVGTFPVSPSFSPSPALDTASVKMSIGTLAVDDFTTTVKLLESLGEAKVLSSPSITVINNQEAKVMVGTREAYITSTQSQADTTTITSESVQFIDVGVKLNLLPTINKDGFVTIRIKPEVSRVASTITTTAGSRVPIIETSEAETIVKVKDGTMIMIAGLMKEEKRNDEVGIPLLSKIPLVGNIFNSKAKQTKKTELIVFLTPHIVQGDVSFSARELQERVPADITSANMQEMIVTDKIKQAQQSNAGGEQVNKIAEEGNKEYSPEAGQDDEKEVFIENKLKGVKK